MLKTRIEYEMLAEKYQQVDFVKCLLFIKKLLSRKAIFKMVIVLIFILSFIWYLNKFVIPHSTVLFIAFSIAVFTSALLVFLVITMPVLSTIIIPLVVNITNLLALTFWAIHCAMVDIVKYLDVDERK